MSRLVASLLYLPDTRDYPQPGQQVGDTVGEFPAGSCIVDLGGRVPPREPDASVGRPQVLQEQADLVIASRKKRTRQALVMRAPVLDAQLAEPVVNRVPAAVRAVSRCGQIDVPPGLLGDPA